MSVSRKAQRTQDVDPAPDPLMDDLPPGQPERRELAIPLRPGVAAVLRVPYPVTEGDWDQFMAVLAAMKPGLVADLASQEAQGGGSA